MQTENDDDNFPYTSDDPVLALPATVSSQAVLNPQQLTDIKDSLRLVLGGALKASDEYTRRLRLIQEGTRDANQPQVVVHPRPDETPSDLARYLLIGLLFKTPDILYQGLRTTERIASRSLDLISRLTSPLTGSSLFGPVRQSYTDLAARGESVVDRLIQTGRIEETSSRSMVQQETVDELINEFLEYIMLKTELRQLIQDEGLVVADDVLSELQQQSSSVDDQIHGRIDRLFRRRRNTPPQTPSST